MDTKEGVFSKTKYLCKLKYDEQEVKVRISLFASLGEISHDVVESFFSVGNAGLSFIQIQQKPYQVSSIVPQSLFSSFVRRKETKNSLCCSSIHFFILILLLIIMEKESELWKTYLVIKQEWLVTLVPNIVLCYDYYSVFIVKMQRLGLRFIV